MGFDEVLAALKAAGNAENQTIYRAHGVKGDTFGVGNIKLRELALEIGTDQPLAQALWQTNNHDARMLAMMILDLETLNTDELESWARDCDNPLIADAVSLVAAQTGHTRELSDRLRDSDEDHAGQIGWNLVAVLARQGAAVASDDWFLPLLDEVEKQVHNRENHTRNSMNVALCGVGISRKELREQALHVAAAIGEVKVDKGVSPNATAVIQRVISDTARRASLRKRMKHRK
jgi:3-methyladenine DNA glycosylase AlkD